jgi:hypothetical protein
VVFLTKLSVDVCVDVVVTVTLTVSDLVAFTLTLSVVVALVVFDTIGVLDPVALRYIVLEFREVRVKLERVVLVLDCKLDLDVVDDVVDVFDIAGLNELVPEIKAVIESNVVKLILAEEVEELVELTVPDGDPDSVGQIDILGVRVSIDTGVGMLLVDGDDVIDRLSIELLVTLGDIVVVFDARIVTVLVRDPVLVPLIFGVDV